jgi:hypothetical protein
MHPYPKHRRGQTIQGSSGRRRDLRMPRFETTECLRTSSTQSPCRGPARRGGSVALLAETFESSTETSDGVAIGVRHQFRDPWAGSWRFCDVPRISAPPGSEYVSSATVLMLPATHSRRCKLQPPTAQLDETRCEPSRPTVSTCTSSVIDHLHVQRHGSRNHSVASPGPSKSLECVLAH